jgi:hypothetical protein
MHLKSTVTAVIITSALTYSFTAANAQEIAPPRCGGNLTTQLEFREYVKKVYKRDKIRQRALDKLGRMRNCAYTMKANRNMLLLQKAEGRKRRARILAARIFPVRPHLRRIAQCESGGDPTAISPNGMYRGKYQFSFSTWQSVGGQGDPAAASEYEQDKRAEMLYKTGGPGHWPVCQFA